MKHWFSCAATWTAHAAGHPVAFTMALFSIVLWAATGPLFGFSDTWQLVINTSTTIITFLMVFLIQATQNRDNLALQAKMDELLRALEGARNEMAGIDELDEDEVKKIRKQADGRG